MANASEAPCVLPYEKGTIPLVFVYGIVFAVGLPANCLTAWLTFIQVKRKNVLGIYLFGLSLCDLVYMGTLPPWMMYVWNTHRWILGPIACKITGYIFFTNMYISILLLCCISVDRYVAVVYAIESRGIRHRRTAITITCAICIAVGLTHSTVFVLKDGDQDQNKTTCFETVPLQPLIANFNYARFIIGFVIPLSVLIFTNSKILKSTKASTSLNEKEKRKVKVLVIAVILIFLVCFAPYHLILLSRAIVFTMNPKNTCWFEIRIYTASVCFLCLATVNSAINPLIYVISSDSVRKELSRGLRQLRRCSFIEIASDSSSFPKLQYSKGSTEIKPNLTSDFSD
ncbi:probable G-protein coupled receptor 132 [Latimeria chalumnae]|uniref:probable G-protein coupled receptor 132 n=1 Tax=Latimeria chalumnae TaxID=7897 RepID=UPI0003C1B04C|nr:PREDICTED: probable G-protein coupled receptor 132 [Latimeria chalumnae]|eukprot:XP_005986435.1 PREDICTED: probable G-protein coupled receptor 132 [Latimeria chalumnae]